MPENGQDIKELNATKEKLNGEIEKLEKMGHQLKLLTELNNCDDNEKKNGMLKKLIKEFGGEDSKYKTVANRKSNKEIEKFNMSYDEKEAYTNGLMKEMMMCQKNLLKLDKGRETGDITTFLTYVKEADMNILLQDINKDIAKLEANDANIFKDRVNKIYDGTVHKEDLENYVSAFSFVSSHDSGVKKDVKMSLKIKTIFKKNLRNQIEAENQVTKMEDKMRELIDDVSKRIDKINPPKHNEVNKTAKILKSVQVDLEESTLDKPQMKNFNNNLNRENQKERNDLE